MKCGVCEFDGALGREIGVVFARPSGAGWGACPTGHRTQHNDCRAFGRAPVVLHRRACKQLPAMRKDIRRSAKAGADPERTLDA